MKSLIFFHKYRNIHKIHCCYTPILCSKYLCHAAWIRTTSLLHMRLKSFHWRQRVALVLVRCGVPLPGCPPHGKRLSLTCHPDRYAPPHSCRNPCSAPGSRYIHLKDQGKSHHDDVIKWKHFFALLALCNRWIPLTKASNAEIWCFLWCTWTNSWVNSRNAGGLRRHDAHYDITVMIIVRSCAQQRIKHTVLVTLVLEEQEVTVVKQETGPASI